jgi:hypothetical protein
LCRPTWPAPAPSPPRRRDLIEERSFQRVYIVPPFFVNEVTGRELGSQHRDTL